jgi:hypothetical protein
MSEREDLLWHTLWYIPPFFLVDFTHFMQPNLKPPITTTAQALAYKAELEAIDPSVEFIMTLYLSPDLTADEVRKARKAGIVGMSLCNILKSFQTSCRREIVS